MKILQFPNPILFEKCQEVDQFDQPLLDLLNQMHETMLSERGIGLSANQVGSNKRLFVMSYMAKPLFLINPKIVWKSREMSSITEGCLSAPGEFLHIFDRASIVKVEFQDENGIKKSKIFNDIHSIVCQHEIDHLNGKSFLQSKTLTKETRKELEIKWKLRR